METEQIQLDLEKLHKQFNKKVCRYYKKRKIKIAWDNEYNIESELTEIKKIWSDVLYAECEEVMKSKSNKKNANENKIKDFYNEHFKKYENDWELTDNDVPLYFLDTFEEEAIDSSEKLKALIDFTTNKLKFKDDFYDDYFMAHIIDKLRFGDTSSLTKNDLFFVLDLNTEKNLSLSRLVRCAKKFELDYSDFEKLLSFAGSYELPDAKNESKDYKKQANAFFKLIDEVIQNSKKSASNPVENFKIVQKIFVYINGSMPKFKHLFSEIDEYKSGIELSNCLNEHCINICLSEQNSGGGDIKVEIDYCVWFNKFVFDQAIFFPSYSRDLNDDLNRLYKGLVSDFSNEMKKCRINMTEEIKEELILNQDGFNNIVENIQYKVIQSPDDFNCFVNFIKSKAKDVGITSGFCYLIFGDVLNKDNVQELLKLDKNNSLSISHVSFIFNCKVDVEQRYTFKDITKFLLAAKNRFTKSKKSGNDKKINDKKREEDVKNFCDLLAYFFKHVDENETEYIKFEQDIFDWIGKNIPEVEFFEKVIKNPKKSELKSKNFTNNKLEDDFSNLWEQFESYAEHMLHLKRKKYTEDTAEVEFFGRAIKNSNLRDVLKHRWVRFNNKDNKLEPDFSELQRRFEFFAGGYISAKETKYQDLNELSKAYDTLIDEFLKSKVVNQTYLQKVKKAGYEEKSKQALKLRKSESVQLFIKNISPNIIKSSDGLKLFLENVNKVMGKSIDFSNYDSFMNLVIDLIVDDSVDVGDILEVLKCFPPKKAEKAGQKKGTENKLKLTTLLTCCQKIKNDQKWNLGQVKKFLKYGFAGTTTKNISDSVDSFFKLLIIFISNADLKNKMYNSDLEKADIEDNEDIKNNVDMTYEKFVNEILAYAKKLYFKQEKFTWCKYFDYCNNIGELQKILAEKNINIPELQYNKFTGENKLNENREKSKTKTEITNTESDIIQNKIQNQVETKTIAQIERQNTEQNKLEYNKTDEKNQNTSVRIDNEDNLKVVLTSTKNIISSTIDKNDNTLPKNQIKLTKKSDNIQRYSQHQPTNLIPSTKKTSYFILIAKIVLYVLAVLALAVFIFSIIKTFWFLAMLSVVLCFVFTFIAHKIKYKTIDEKPNQMSTGYPNYQPEITGQYKNNELNPTQMPETIKDTDGKDKKIIVHFPNQN